MKALVVYDSLYGNTEKISQAIGAALSAGAEVECLRVADVKPERLKGTDLIVVGSPTHGSKASPAMKAWLKALPANSLRGVKVAAIDTRVAPADTGNRIASLFIKLFGYAADPIAKSLVKCGGTLAAPAEGFFVEDTEGPLKDGELERAAAWGQQMLKTLATP